MGVWSEMRIHKIWQLIWNAQLNQVNFRKWRSDKAPLKRDLRNNGFDLFFIKAIRISESVSTFEYNARKYYEMHKHEGARGEKERRQPLITASLDPMYNVAKKQKMKLFCEKWFKISADTLHTDCNEPWISRPQHMRHFDYSSVSPNTDGHYDWPCWPDNSEIDFLFPL